MECDAAGGWEILKGWKMENRRSWPKRAGCASSLVQGGEVVSNTLIRRLKLLNGNYQCSL